MKKFTIVLVFSGLGLIFADYALAEIDFGAIAQGKETILYVEKYGRGEPVTVNTGYLFVNFRYIPAPYTIQRIGQAVLVNDTIVNCLYKEEIPENFKQHTSEFEDKNGKTHKWSSSAHPAKGLDKLGDLYVNILCETLYSRSVFLSKSRYQANSIRPMSDQAMQRCMPRVWQPDTAELVRMLDTALKVAPDEESADVFKENHGVGKLEDEDVLLLINNARESPALLERIRVEASGGSSFRDIPVPVYANRAPHLAVARVTLHDIKLKAIEAGGHERKFGYVWEFKDIIFVSTNQVIIDAVNYPGLPRLSRINADPLLLATIISKESGQAVTASITDSLKKTIHLDNVEYQVIDIRPFTKTVLLKNCKTGEKLFVEPQNMVEAKQKKENDN